MALFVVISFCVCNTPAHALNLLEAFKSFDPGSLSVTGFTVYTYINFISNALVRLRLFEALMKGDFYRCASIARPTFSSTT